MDHFFFRHLYSRFKPRLTVLTNDECRVLNVLNCLVVQTCSTCQMLHDVTEPFCWNSLVADRDAICLSHGSDTESFFSHDSFRKFASNILANLRILANPESVAPLQSAFTALCASSAINIAAAYLCQGLSLRSQISTSSTLKVYQYTQLEQSCRLIEYQSGGGREKKSFWSKCRNDVNIHLCAAACFHYF